MYHRFVALMLIVLTAPLFGCGEGKFFVRGQLFKPQPAIPALEDSKGEEAYNIWDIVGNTSGVPNGTVDIDFTDGTKLIGFLDRVNGTFDWTYDFKSANSALATLREYGSLTFDGDGLLRAAYNEHAEYKDGSEKFYDLELSVDGNFLLLTGHDEQDAAIESVTTIAFDRIDVRDSWDLPEIYRLDVTSTYFTPGPGSNVRIRQEVVRDDRTTPGASPDQESLFVLYWDLSGTGVQQLHYAEGVEARREIDFYGILDGGGAEERLSYEDPATVVSPDGEGVFNFAGDASGDGTYIERYDDTSEYNAHYIFTTTFDDDVLWAFDLAESPVPIDLDGEIHYVRDRSGTGNYTRYETVGPVETCNYAFDSEDQVTQMSCSDPSKFVPEVRGLQRLDPIMPKRKPATSR